MIVKGFYIIALVLLVQCCRHTRSEISESSKMLEEAREYVNSPEAHAINKRLENEGIITQELISKIEGSKSDLRIRRKTEIIEVSNSLNVTISEIISSIDQAHGKDKNGEVLNRRETKFVDSVMFDSELAAKLKTNMNEFIQVAMGTIDLLQLELTEDQLPLKLNLFIKASGKTWEEYYFKNMPYGAVMPILSKLKNDGILTKLLVLEEISRLN